MASPLRFAVPGGLYHVTSRGDRREAIDAGDADRQGWLALFGAVCARFHGACHVWCQMTNHDHLVGIPDYRGRDMAQTFVTCTYPSPPCYARRKKASHHEMKPVIRFRKLILRCWQVAWRAWRQRADSSSLPLPPLQQRALHAGISEPARQTSHCTPGVLAGHPARGDSR